MVGWLVGWLNFYGISTFVDYLMPNPIYIYILLVIVYLIDSKSGDVKLVTVVKGDQKASFSIATTPRYRGGRYSFPWIALLYP